MAALAQQHQQAGSWGFSVVAAAVVFSFSAFMWVNVLAFCMFCCCVGKRGGEGQGRGFILNDFKIAFLLDVNNTSWC